MNWDGCLQRWSPLLHLLHTPPRYYVPPLHDISPVLTIHLGFSIPSAGTSAPLLWEMSVRENVDRIMWQGVKGWGGENKGGRATVQYSESKGSSGEGRDKERKGGKGGGWVRGHERWCVVAKQQLITKSPSILLVMPCLPSKAWITHTHVHTVRFMCSLCNLSIRSKCWCSFNLKNNDRIWYFDLEQWSRSFKVFYKLWFVL